MHARSADIEDLLTTTRSVRRRLDLERPVSRDLVLDCLRVAVQAPSGGNHQIWRWVVVSDPLQRRRIGAIYRRTNLPYVQTLERESTTDAQTREAASARALTDNLERVPILVAACFERPPWMARDGYGNASAFGSVFPAVWNFQLACRSVGLASCTLTSQIQDHAAIAEVLKLPDSFEQACLLAVAFPDTPRFSPARRAAIDTVVRFDTWDDPLSETT